MLWVHVARQMKPVNTALAVLWQSSAVWREKAEYTAWAGNSFRKEVATEVHGKTKVEEHRIGAPRLMSSIYARVVQTSG